MVNYNLLLLLKLLDFLCHVLLSWHFVCASIIAPKYLIFFAAKRHMLQITNILGLVLYMPNVIFSFYYVAYLTPFKANFAYLDNLFSLFMHYESRVWNSFKFINEFLFCKYSIQNQEGEKLAIYLRPGHKYLEAKSSLGNWSLVKGQ